MRFHDSVSPHSVRFCSCRSTSKFLDFSLCASWASNFVPIHVVAIRLFFSSEGAVVRTNILSPDLSCSSQVDCWLAVEKFESNLNIGDRVHELPFQSRQTVCTQWSCLVSSQEMISWLGWSNRKGGSGVSVLFTFVSVDSCSSTGERNTGSATWDWQEHPAFVCFVSLSLSLSLFLSLFLLLSLSLSFSLFFSLSPSFSLSISLSLSLSLSLETCTSFFFYSFSSLSSASAIIEIDELFGACCSPAAEPPRKQICRRRL